MNCPGCAHENLAGAKFCEECGTPLARACANCGTELRPTVKFCSECGTPVAGSGAASSPPRPASQPAPTATPPAPSAGTRKIVTIVFADLAGSTALQERLDPESTSRFMESYYDAMRDAVESHGGTVTQFLGDGVKAVFGIPRVAEDDAIRAVRAAVAMQENFHALAERQRAAVGAVGLRVAVNTGEVIANDDAEIIGDPVNVAARLQELGGNGEVVVGDTTARLVEALVTLAPLGSFALKGRTEQVPAFRVESLDPPASAATAAFVGRDEEIARVTSVYETAVGKPATALAVLLGSPGLGKSRLIGEFARRLGDTTRIVEVHCDEASSATFAPLALALRELLGIEAGASAETLRAAVEATISGDDPDRARIAAGVASLLAGSPASLEETFFVVRRLFAALASARPVVLVIDDLQWAEPLLLDLVEHLIEWGSGVPLLVLVGARPELRDKRASLATPGGLVADVLTLSGLDAGAAMRLAANVIGATDLPAVVAAKVLATSEGNPLFVGELVRMLVHEGALKREGDRWTTGTALAALEIPPTIHALLAARIERLRPEERIVLERAAVIGRHFSRSAVAALLPGHVSDLDARLEALGRSELIERDTGWFLGEPVLRFHHVLIRDAAYRQLLKGTRAQLHTRFADWVVERAGDAGEHDETIGWHLEQSHQFLRELGPIDAKGRAIGDRASTHLAAAGRRALAGDDVPLAASLLGRAIERLDSEDPSRGELSLDWCEALLAAGDVGAATGAIDELHRFVGDSARLRAWHTCFAGQHTVLTAPEGLQTTADEVAAAAESLASQSDDAGEAKAHFVHALALAALGKIGACEAALDHALAAARRVAGDRRRANTVLAIAPLAALWGPSPVTRASGRCLDVVRVLRITQGAPAVEAVALSCQGVLEALRGRTDAARRMIASARKMVEELGITQRLLEVDVFAGLVDLHEGDSVAAEGNLRGAYEGLRDLGLGIAAAQAAALLARALLAQDRVADAETLSHESESLAGDDLKAAIAWRGVRAEALARRGEHGAAVEFASKAVEIATATDALLDHADARLALAAALRAAGRGREADAEERRAHELWEAKGATLLAERARGAPISSPVVEEPVAPPTAVRRVRPNAATAALTRMDAAIAARQFDAVRALYSESHVMIEHPIGSTFGPDAGISSLERLFRGRDPFYEIQPLATLGDRLVLTRRRSGAEGAVSRSYDVGAYENQVFHAQEVDERGLFARAEVFASDRLNEGIAWLYERHAELLPDGVARERALLAARSLTSSLLAPNDLELMATLYAPDLESVDHRPLRTWSLRGLDSWLEHMRALQAVADDIAVHIEDILALEPNALLVQQTHSGIERVGGGVYERAFIALFATGADGQLARIEWFEEHRATEALARFDELVGGSSPASTAEPFANLASRADDTLMHCFNTRDWAGVEALATPGLVFEDRRRLQRITVDADDWLTMFRFLFDVPESRFSTALVATRGERLSLHRNRFEGEVAKGGGPLDRGEELALFEVGPGGRIVAIVLFDLAEVEAAHAELDARFKAGEGAANAHTLEAVLSLGDTWRDHDWDGLAACCAPGFVYRDHRLLGFGTMLDDATKWARSQQALVELAPDTRTLADHLRISERGALRQLTQYGTRDGGAFETPFFSNVIVDEAGAVLGIDLFDIEKFDAARAHFEALGTAAGPAAPFANPASHAHDTLYSGFNAGDWAGIQACVAPDLVFDERRRMVRNTCSREIWLEQLRVMFDVPSSRFSWKLLATRGERLSLHWHGFEGEVADGGGPLEMDPHLSLHELDQDGRIIAIVLFELEDAASAYAELDTRFESVGEAAADLLSWHALRNFRRAVADRDWDGVIALCDPELIEYDHRSLAVLGTTRGAEAWVQNFRTQAELAPDTIYRDHHFLPAARGYYVNGGWFGAGERGDYGAYEIPLIAVVELDARGKYVRVDIYDDDVEAAFVRLAELAGPAASPFANGASRSLDRFVAAFHARDWARVEAAFGPEMRQIDRRDLMHLDLDRAGHLKSLRFSFDMASSRFTIDELATRGDRLMLARMRLDLADGATGPSEIEFLGLNQTNAHGDIVGLVRWNVDDLDAAYAELDARFEAEGEVDLHRQNWRCIRSFVHSVVERDWDAVAALCADELIEYDHRSLAVLGTTRGGRAWAQNFSTLVELASDTVYRVHHFLPEAHGHFVHGGWYGQQEGGDYEMPLNAVLELDERGLIVRADIYDDDVEAALKRLSELTEPATSTPVLTNAATRASERHRAAWEARDWERFAQLLPAGFCLSDRRRGVQLEMDRDEMVAFGRSVGDLAETRIVAETLATRGERLTLERRRAEVSGGDVEPSQIAYLTLLETNDRGVVTSIVRWDADQLEAAYAELETRFAAIGSIAARGPHAVIAKPNAASLWLDLFREMFNARDWEGHALFAPQARYEDRQSLSLLSGGLDMIMSSLRERAETGAQLERHELLGTAGDRVAIHRTLWAGGGDDGRFEMEFLILQEVDEAGRLVATINFDLDDSRSAQREAWARWSASDPDAARATSALGEQIDAFNEHDRERYRRVFADDLIVEDHRHAGMGRLEGADAYIDSLVALWELAPVTRIEAGRFWPALGRHAALSDVRRTGTVPGGGEFESEYLNLAVFADGVVTRLELFEVDALDEALARFDALEASAPPAPNAALVQPNAASAGIERWLAALPAATATDDWDGMRAVYAPDMTFEDRQRRSQLSGDRELAIASLRERRAMGARTTVSLVATAGDRIAVSRLLWTGGPSDGRFEMEHLSLTEVDAAGAFITAILFDGDDTRAALREAWARWATTDPVAAPIAELFIELTDAWNERSAAGIRARLADDIVVHDHRLAGFGRLEGADAYVNANQVLWDLAPDQRLELPSAIVAVRANSVLAVVRREGAVPDGGGAFESVYLWLWVIKDGRITHLELFDDRALEAALARFEELCPGSDT